MDAGERDSVVLTVLWTVTMMPLAVAAGIERAPFGGAAVLTVLFTAFGLVAARQRARRASGIPRARALPSRAARKR
jgi:hypothetical protein